MEVPDFYQNKRVSSTRYGTHSSQNHYSKVIWTLDGDVNTKVLSVSMEHQEISKVTICMLFPN